MVMIMITITITIMIMMIAIITIMIMNQMGNWGNVIMIMVVITIMIINLVNPDIEPSNVHLCILTPCIRHHQFGHQLLVKVTIMCF